jgi:hypothetical protein
MRISLSRPTPKNVLPTHLRIIALSNDRHFAVVITMANARQPFVGCPSIEAHGVKVAQVNSAARKRFMEFDHQRFVFRPNRTDSDLSSVFHRPAGDIRDGYGRGSGFARCLAFAVGSGTIDTNSFYSPVLLMSLLGIQRAGKGSAHRMLSISLYPIGFPTLVMEHYGFVARV